MAWILLIIAGLFETAFALCLGKAQQAAAPHNYNWYAGFVACLAISMLLLMKAVRTLPVGTAYAVWTGIGAVGAVIAGIVFLKEPATVGRLFFLVTLILSIVGLKVMSS